MALPTGPAEPHPVPLSPLRCVRPSPVLPHSPPAGPHIAWLRLQREVPENTGLRRFFSGPGASRRNSARHVSAEEPRLERSLSGRSLWLRGQPGSVARGRGLEDSPAGPTGLRIAPGSLRVALTQVQLRGLQAATSLSQHPGGHRGPLCTAPAVAPAPQPPSPPSPAPQGQTPPTPASGFQSGE